MYREAAKTAGNEGRLHLKDRIELVEEATRSEESGDSDRGTSYSLAPVPLR